MGEGVSGQGLEVCSNRRKQTKKRRKAVETPLRVERREKKSRRDPAQGRAKREEKPSRLRSGRSEEMHVKTIYDTQAEPPRNENQQKTKKAKEKAPPQTSG